MKIKATVELKSISAYSQSKHYETPKKDKESSEAYEARTWRERMHVNDKGNVVIPAMQFKNCLSAAAKFNPISIPGRGKSTFTKNFEAGVLVVEETELDVKKEEVMGEWFFVPSDGIRGSGKRVKKCFPCVPNWDAKVEFWVLDSTITKEVFQKTLEEAGSFIGIGRFRPRNNGFYGRFIVKKLQWEEIE